MQTPLLLATSTTGPSTSASRYTGFTAGATASSWMTTFAAVATPIAAAGTISGLSVCFPATGAGSYTITLLVNDVASALTCTVNLTTSSLASDATHSVSVSAGDLVGWQVTPTGTPTAQTNVQISSVFTGSTAGDSVVFGGSTATADVTQLYLAPGGVDERTTDAGASVVIPTAGTIDKLYINLSAAPGTGTSRIFTVYKNGAATGVTCTAADTAIAASDLTHSVVVAAGDTISLLADVSGAVAASVTRFGFRFRPTTDGESLLLQHFTGSPSAAVDRFANVMGASGNVSTEATVVALAPIAFTARRLFLNLGTAPGSGKNRDVILRNGPSGALVDTALTASVTATATAANDISDSVSVAAGSFISHRTTSAASAVNPVTMRIGMVAYIAPGAAPSAQPFMLTLLGVG